VKKIIKTFVFTFISLYFTGILFNGFNYSGDVLYAFLLIVLGLGVVNYFFPIMARFLSLPHGGIFSIIISTGLNFIMLYLFDKFVPQFSVGEGNTPSLIIFGFVLTSIGLTEMWLMVLSSASLTSIYKGLFWLSTGKEKK
jgi:hypothetical protein